MLADVADSSAGEEFCYLLKGKKNILIHVCLHCDEGD